MRLAAIASLVALLGLALAQPVQAQTYQTTFGVHYWGAPLNFGNPAPPTASDSGTGWGFTLRFDHRQSPWSFSGRYDSLSVTPVNWPWNGANVWDANVHYRFGPNLDSYLGVLAGWGGVNVNSTDPTQAGGANGPRIGAEFLYRQPSGLYFTGQAVYGFSWNTNLTGFPGLPNGNAWDLRIGAGYEFTGGWGLEAGWRYLSWKVPAGPGCFGPSGCEWQFSGVTAALTFRR